MRLLRCDAGHYYDADTFSLCPHCAEGDNSATIESAAIAGRVPAGDMTAAPTAGVGWGHVPQNIDPGVTVPLERSSAPDNDATVGVYMRKDAPVQPVAGWLVCVEGPSLGRDYRIVSGRNSIGRDSGNAICITEDRSVSRAKHAIVTYDPHSNSFFVQPGDSTEMCYINSKVVLEPVPLSSGDILAVGKTNLMFIPCCSDKFSWSILKNGGGLDV